jgi:hypothetical protein
MGGGFGSPLIFKPRSWAKIIGTAAAQTLRRRDIRGRRSAKETERAGIRPLQTNAVGRTRPKGDLQV